MVVTRSKEVAFGFVRNNVQQRIGNWKGKLLSTAGKEVLLKSVVMALPTYTMSVFKLSKRICQDITSKMANFWWGDAERKGRMHWIGWKQMTKLKKDGGLGFRDIQIYNHALLMKQLWRLLTSPNLLVSKVLKAKYYKSTTLFEAKVPTNASWIWQSLASVRELMQTRMRRRIGNGRKTNIWKDKWISGNDEGRVTTKRPPNCSINSVNELIIDYRWNMHKLLRNFCQKDVEEILNITISLSGKGDGNYWAHSRNGEYSVQTGYRLGLSLLQKEDLRKRNDAESRLNRLKESVWSILWSLNVKCKIKHFIWKCLHQGLPAREMIYQRTGNGDPICKCCGEGAESIERVAGMSKS